MARETWIGKHPGHDEEAAVRADNARLRAEVEELCIALTESVGLQSHYARLLNEYDGGKRIGFDSVDAWIARLRVVGKLPARRG